MYVDVDRIFSFHPATASETAQLHEEVRSKCREVAIFFRDNLPDSPERILAIRKLQEAMMYANSAVAQYF